MLTFQYIYDVIMVSWFSVLFVTTIYKCKSYFYKKGKHSEEFDEMDYNKNINPTFTKKFKSYSNFNSFYDNCSDKEDITTSNIQLPVQKRSNECFRCNRKLNTFGNCRDFYAFDQQLCENCWNNLNYNIVNTPL